MGVSATHRNASSPIRAWVVVVGLLSVATGGGLLLDHHVSLASQAMLYVLAVVIASYALSLLPSVLCALAAVTAFNFFFVPPRWTFEVESGEHLIALFVMLVVALVISHLSAALQRKTESARVNAMRARQLQELATALAEVNSIDAAIKQGKLVLDNAFCGPTTLAVLSADHTLQLAAQTPQFIQDGLAACMHESAPLGPGTGRWPGLDAWYLPIGSKGQMQGAVCIEHILAADNMGREHAQALCALLGQCLLRLKVVSDMRQAQAEIQRQQVQSTFLAAISHDLRTPLAAVMGAASALQDQGKQLGAAEQQRLLGSIVTEASYLSVMTENTLQLVQLTNAAQPPRRSWESIEEIVGTVVSRIRLRDTTQRIATRVPGGLPLIEVDAVLIAQLVANLLDNALKYSDKPIDLVVDVTSTEMQISVEDRGELIPPSVRDSLFEPYCRNDHSGQRGLGLGLALCRAIALAHNGSLTLRPRQGGGNCFSLTLPVNVAQPKVEMP